jgi:hypothetical protein
VGMGWGYLGGSRELAIWRLRRRGGVIAVEPAGQGGTTKAVEEEETCASSRLSASTWNWIAFYREVGTRLLGKKEGKST